MEMILKKILDCLFYSRYSFLISEDYYEGLFLKYFSVKGFILGFIFVLIIYYSSIEDNKKIGFFKVLPIVAVINSCSVLANFINKTLNQEFTYIGTKSVANSVDNIISGFVLTLVVFSCCKRFERQAFLLGIATHAALPFLNYTYLEYMSGRETTLMILRIVLAGFLCLIISYRKYFYTSWIWYFSFHMFLRIVGLIFSIESEFIIRKDISGLQYTFISIIKYLSQFTVDAIIFAVILAFAIVFERDVLTAKNTVKAM